MVYPCLPVWFPFPSAASPALPTVAQALVPNDLWPSPRGSAQHSLRFFFSPAEAPRRRADQHDDDYYNDNEDDSNADSIHIDVCIYIGMTRTNELTMMMTYNNDNNLITMNELIMTMIVLITIVLIVMTIPEPAASLGSMASSDMVGLHLSPKLEVS